MIHAYTNFGNKNNELRTTFLILHNLKKKKMKTYDTVHDCPSSMVCQTPH
jgi:hypothetical protein